MTLQLLHPVGLKSQAVNFQALPPLSLYIHIPWCVRKCPYCDFNSHEARGDVPEAAYVDALIRDLEMSLPQIWGRKVYSVFFGGGTPSLLSAPAIEKILSQVRMLLPLDVNAEITLEANPGTVEADKFKLFREAGVNRLSLGIQSFNEIHLKALGRIHNSGEACHAIELAQSYFENINLDLMYGLPEQTLEQVKQDVSIALQFAPQHLSYYQLTLEPNTLFYRYPPSIPDADASGDMQLQIESKLAENGYQHYETSAFAQPKNKSRHNLNYWQFGDYLGIGAGAHSKISSHDRVIRQTRYKQPKAYMDQTLSGSPVQTVQHLTRDDLSFEFMMNALRLNDGFSVDLFTERTSLPMVLIRGEIERAEQRGLLQHDIQHIKPTEMGRNFLNDLLEIFLKENTSNNRTSP